MDYLSDIVGAFKKAMFELYGFEVNESDTLVNQTKKEFDGDYTIVLFPFTKPLQKSPESLGNEVGLWITQNCGIVSNYNVIKGFLNLSLTDSFWLTQLS